MAHSSDYDFIGFTFGETHFYKIHVLHVSDGSRYNDNLAPTMQDKTVQVPGGHGTYYFGSYYTQRTFSVQVAYDKLTEEDIRTLRQMTNWGVQKLIFDEQPYKTYMAKLSGTPQLKYICFDENGSRIYKGEGTINFVSYYPYASSIETKEATILVNGSATLANDGDVETDSLIWVDLINQVSINTQYTISIGGKSLKFKIASKKTGDYYICFNSRTNLVEGYSGTSTEVGTPTGTLYNDAIVSGDFLKVPVGNSIFTSTIKTKVQFSELYY